MTLISCGEICKRLIKKIKAVGQQRNMHYYYVTMDVTRSFGNKQSVRRRPGPEVNLAAENHNVDFNHKVNFNPHPFLLPRSARKKCAGPQTTALSFLCFGQASAGIFSYASQAHKAPHYLPQKLTFIPKCNEGDTQRSRPMLGISCCHQHGWLSSYPRKTTV